MGNQEDLGAYDRSDGCKSQSTVQGLTWTWKSQHPLT